MDIEIRYINSMDDRNKLSNIYEESWKHAYRGIIPQDYLNAIPKGQWNKNFDITGWNTVVLIKDGAYIGTSSFCKSRFEKYSDSGEVISIYLLPEYMGKGYGNKLLNFVMNEIIEQGFKEVFLWVLEDNHIARRFYENYGFEFDGDYIDDNIGGKNLREVRYVYKFS